MLFWQRENIMRMPPEVVGPAAAAPVLDPEEVARRQFRASIIDEVNKIYIANSPIAIQITNGLVDRFAAMRPDARDAFVEQTKKALEYRSKAIWRHTNVLRQEAEIRKSFEDPGAIDVRVLVPEMKDRMGLEGHKARWMADIESYGPEFDTWAPRQDKIDQIVNNGNPAFHSKPFHENGNVIASDFRRHLFEAKKQTTEMLERSSEEIKSLIETGAMPPKKPTTAKSVAKAAANKSYDLAGRLAAPAFNCLQGIVHAAGKGIYSKSDPLKDSSYLKKYYRERDRHFSSLLWNLNPAESKSSALMSRYKKLLAKSHYNPDGSPNETGLMDEATFNELADLITEEVKKADRTNAAKMDEFNKNMKELNAKALESAKEQTADSDAMLKWRILQAALIITPFAGLSIMGPLTHVFSGVFMNAQGLGHGIASLATSEYTGPFGTICELLHIDDAIRWLLCDMPVVHNVIDVADSLTSSHLMQGLLGGIALPMASGPLVPIAVAGVFSLFRANAEIEYHKKYDEAFKAHQKAIRAEIDKMAEAAGKIGDEWDARSFIDKQFNILQDFHRKAELVEYVTNQCRRSPTWLEDNMDADIMTEMAAYERVGEGGKTHKVFDANGKMSEKELMNFLSENKALGERFFDRVTLFSALERKEIEAKVAAGEEDPDVDVAAVTAKLREVVDPNATKALKMQAQQLMAKEKALQREEYVLRIAQDRNVDCSKVLEPGDQDFSEEERSKEIAKIEEAMKEAEAKFFKEEASKAVDRTLEERFKAPSSVPRPKGAARIVPPSQQLISAAA